MADDTPDWLKNYNASNAEAVSALQGQSKSNAPQGIFANINPLYLSAAQGFLAPTKTGGFGESVSNAAGQVASPLAAMKQAQMTALEKIAALQKGNAELNMQAPLYAARADMYSAKADGSLGGDSTNIQRNLLAGQMKAIDNAVPGQTINPSTGIPFVDDAEIENYQALLTSRYLALTPKGTAQGNPQGGGGRGGTGVGNGVLPRLGASDKDKYNALPPGTAYIGPDGQVRVKPDLSGKPPA